MLPQDVANQNVETVLAQAGSGPLPLIPEGEYQGMFVKDDLVDTKSGTGKMLVMEFLINQGPHSGTVLKERLNIVNQNDTAVKIARETLARIAKAVGLQMIPGNSDALLRKPLLVRVTTEAGNTYTDNNGVQQQGKDFSRLDSKGYAPLPGGVQAGAPIGQSAPAAGAMPWQ
jgi:hypothetical protein